MTATTHSNRTKQMAIIGDSHASEEACYLVFEQFEGWLEKISDQ